MYRKFESPIPPTSRSFVSNECRYLFDPPSEGDIVTFKVAESVHFGVLVEIIESSSIKGEVTMIGGIGMYPGRYDNYEDWRLGDKIEVDVDKLNGIIKK